MDYIELKCKISPYTEQIADILIAQLGEIEYESFTNEDECVNAYIQASLFSQQEVDELIINNLPGAQFTIKYSNTFLKSQDWNAIWESNFKPVIIGDKVVIRASFHTDTPEVEYDIIIDPKMSFGTGHHSTTSLMVQNIIEVDMAEKNVLDMGCGTSLLAILASMRGAKHITAIDIDEWAFDNSKLNIELNNISNIDLKMGDASLLIDQKFDIILANINRNILINDMSNYCNCLATGGSIVMSGYYSEDLEKIKEEAVNNNLEFVNSKVDNNWTSARFVKK